MDDSHSIPNELTGLSKKSEKEIKVQIPESSSVCLLMLSSVLIFCESVENHLYAQMRCYYVS